MLALSHGWGPDQRIPTFAFYKMNKRMDLLEVTGITRFESERPAVAGVSFSLGQYTRCAVMGETGSGKSTLLKLVAGLVQPSSGQVVFNGERVMGPEEVLIPGHPGIAYLSQHFELLKNYRVIELMEMASKMNEEEAGLVFKLCAIDHLLQRKTNQLSGGERQRIALARLLLTKPSLLLLDEPFTNLDMQHKRIINKVVRELTDQLGIRCILVSHDPVDTLSWAEQMLIMKDGIVVQQGSPQAMYQKPANAYVAGLLGEFNLIAADHTTTCNAWGLNPVHAPYFIRPEQVYVAQHPTGGLKGKVVQVKYCGAYHSIEVETEDAIIILYTYGNVQEQGETVELHVALQEKVQAQP